MRLKERPDLAFAELVRNGVTKSRIRDGTRIYIIEPDALGEHPCLSGIGSIVVSAVEKERRRMDVFRL
jgi:hypothetical protein